MRESTHVIFGLGVGAIVAKMLKMNTLDMGLSLVGSIIIHEIIDYFGHEYHFWQSHPRRLQFTHSIFGVFLIATFLTIIIGLPAFYVNGVGHYLIFWPILASGLSHLVLDALTPNGVFICGKRVSLRVCRSNNPIANIALQFVGVALLCFAFCRS